MSRQTKGFRCANFTVDMPDGRKGVGFAALVGGDGERQAAFAVVDDDGVPTAVTRVIVPEAAASETSLEELYIDTMASLGERARWHDQNLSSGLSHLGLFRGVPDDLAAAAAAAVETASRGKLPRDQASAIVSGQIADALAPLRAALDDGALKALRAAGSFSKSDFTFYASKDEKRGRLRRQAADAYPVLAAVMARNLRAKLAIDRAEPLGEALVAALGERKDGIPTFSKALLRRLQGVEWTVPEGIGAEWLGEKLAALPPDWFPKTPEEWDAFVTLADGLGRNLPHVLGVGFEDLLAGSGGKWKEFLRRLAKAYTDTRPPEGLDEAGRVEWLRAGGIGPDESAQALRNAAVGLEDMVDQFSRLVVLPAAALACGEDRPYLGEIQKTTARHAAARILLGGKNAAAMFELSRHYHTQAERVLAEATGEPVRKPEQYRQVADDGWAPLCNQVQAPNGVFIVPCTDPRELADEGRHGKNEDGSTGLHHCVGGYSASCRNNGHHILSMRRYSDDGTFKRLSTMEVLQIAEGDTVLKTRQHSGMGNGAVPADALEAWRWFEEAVRTTLVPLNYEGIRSYMVTTAKNRRDDVERTCGFEWKEDGAVERAIRAFSEWCGKGVRGLGPAEFCALPEIQETAETISPKRIVLAS